jgi:hypothetical protein
MSNVETRVADFLGKNPAFRKQVAKFLLSQGLLEEGYTLSSTEPEVTHTLKPREKNTTATGHVVYWSKELLRDRAEDVARTVRLYVPVDILDDCRGKTTESMKRKLQYSWKGKKAVQAVASALGEPNSKSNYKSQIGARSAGRFVNRYLVPYFLLEDDGYFNSDPLEPKKEESLDFTAEDNGGLEGMIASNLDESVWVS